MNILVINGSPRKKGLISQMLDIMREEAEQRGDKGYGLKLLQYALEKAKEMGIGLLQMEGNIEFYKHARLLPNA